MATGRCKSSESIGGTSLDFRFLHSIGVDLVPYVKMGEILIHVREKIQKLNHKNLKGQAKLPHVMSDQTLGHE